MTKLTIAIAAALAVGASNAETPAPPEPVLPTVASGQPMTGPLGNPAALPGPFPDEPMGAVIELAPTPDGERGAIARVLAASPLGVTVNWANPGDVDINLSPTDPTDPLNDPLHPAWGVQRTASNLIAVLGGPPTYAWAPHAARGVLFASVATLEPDPASGEYVEAHATGAVETQRAGPAYNMLDGQWRPRPDAFGSQDLASAGGNLWIDVIRIGQATEGFATVAAAWFPFLDGWTGGIIPGVPATLTDFPSRNQLAAARAIPTVGHLRRIDFDRSPPTRPLPWLEEAHTYEVYTEFEGDVNLKGGNYTLTAAGDDAFELAVHTGASWQRLAGVGGLHGVLEDAARIELPAGTHRLRLRHFQATRHWALRLTIEGGEFPGPIPVTFAGPGAAVRAWSFDAPTPYAVGLERDPWTDRPLGSPGLPETFATWIDPPDRSDPARAIAQLNLPAHTPDDAILFTQHNSNNHSALLASAPTGNGWTVVVTDTALAVNPGTPFKNRHRGFTFLAVDKADPRVAVAEVAGASGRPRHASPGIGVERAAEGVYHITLPIDAPPAPNGVALLQLTHPDADALVNSAPRFAVWEQAPDGVVVVHTRRLLATGQTEPTDADFAFLWLGGLRTDFRAREAFIAP